MAGQDAADPHRIYDQTLRALRGVLHQRGGALTLRLNPPDLGTLRIRVTLQHNAVSARFEAASEAVSALLSRQMGQLRAALQSHGLTVEHVQVQTQQNAAHQHGLAQHQDDAAPDGRSRGAFDGDDPPHDRRRGDEGEPHADRAPPDFARELLDLIA